MQSTIFTDFIAKWFNGLLGRLTEKYNDQQQEPTLLHKSMLDEEYTADLSWGSTSLNHAVVAADVVALDSSLPLKKRGVIQTAAGSVSKIGVKYRRGEKFINDVNTLIARGTNESTIAQKILDDTKRVVDAINIRKEIMFEQALSTGVILVHDASDSAKDNDGTGVRASFGYLEENQFKSALAPWEAPFAQPIDDIKLMFDKANADSNAINHVYLSKKYFNYIRNSEQGKFLAATFNGQLVTENTILAVPSRSTFLDALSDEFGATFHIVDNVYRIEKPDGTFDNIRPWAEANVVGTPSDKVGRMIYGTLAEETNPVNGVTYGKVGSDILVSKFSKTDPLEEFTAGQALCIPVIDNADGIYVLTANEASEDVLTVEGGNLNSDGETITAAKSASTKTFNVKYAGDLSKLSVSSSETFVTPTLSNGTVSCSVSANSASSAPARSAEITVTDGYTSVKVTINQAANT